MRQILKASLLGTAAIFLGACGTVGQPQSIAGSIITDAIELNEAHNATNTAIIFKNILRARDRWPTTFTTLSEVQSSPSLTRGSDISLSPLGLGNPSGPFQSSSSKLTNSAKAGTLYKVAPFGSKDGTTSNILRRLDIAVFKDYFERWPKDVITLLFVNNIKNEKSGYRARNDGENIADFRRDVAYALGVRQEDLNRFNFKDHLTLKNAKKDTNSSCISKRRQDFPSYDAFADFAKKMKDSYDGSASLVNGANGDVELKLCKKSEDSYRLVLKQDDENPIMMPTQPQELSFDIRSVREIVYYLGESLRSDQYVVESGCTEPVRNQFGQVLYTPEGRARTRKSLGPLFEVRNSRNRMNVSYAARIRHTGDMYYAIPNDREAENLGYCLNDRSNMAMSVLNQLLIINQSPEALKSPQTLFER